MEQAVQVLNYLCFVLSFASGAEKAPGQKRRPDPTPFAPDTFLP
jgi:hypothetical protein